MEKQNITKRIDGFFILGLNEKKVVQNYSHDFTYHLCRYLDEAFKKDKSLETLWNGSLSDLHSNDFINIIKEVSEYYLLCKLSHTACFDTSGDDNLLNLLKKHQREDLPELVSTNRFFNLFTSPETQSRMGRFALQLPDGSIFTRNSETSFTIHNKWFSITIKTAFQSAWAYTGIGFCELYLELKKVTKFYRELSVSYEINATFHNQSLETEIGKHYSELINEFINQLNKDFGKDYYFEKKIQWEQTSVIVDILLKRMDQMMELIGEKNRLI